MIDSLSCYCLCVRWLRASDLFYWGLCAFNTQINEWLTHFLAMVYVWDDWAQSDLFYSGVCALMAYNERQTHFSLHFWVILLAALPQRIWRSADARLARLNQLTLARRDRRRRKKKQWVAGFEWKKDEILWSETGVDGKGTKNHSLSFANSALNATDILLRGKPQDWSWCHEWDGSWRNAWRTFSVKAEKPGPMCKCKHKSTLMWQKSAHRS